MKSQDLIEISGSTFNDKTAKLDEVLLREGAQVSVKNSSIISALDWVAKMPKDIFDRRPPLEVHGEVFKKIKRGAVRILTQVDRDNNQLYFFLHQKKAMEYRL